jgi:hypothetical protein
VLACGQEAVISDFSAAMAWDRLSSASRIVCRGPIDVRSELERLVYELCDDHGLPEPLVNTSIEGRVRDFYEQVTRRPRWVADAILAALLRFELA